MTRRAAAVLLAELRHPSLLVRHIALCRLLHGGRYREFTPETLRGVASRLSATADHDRGAARLLECIATLCASELAQAHRAPSPATTTAGMPGLAAGEDPVSVLFGIAAAALGEHGYRTVCGVQGVSLPRTSTV